MGTASSLEKWMLVVEGLTCRFGTKAAVDNASFSVAPGGFIGVIGRSGAGKSTLLRTINRLTPASEGRILYNGVDVTALRGRELRHWRARSAMIFQQFNLVGRLDVLTNVLVGRPAAACRDRPRDGAGARYHSRRRADCVARSPQYQDRDGCAAAHQQAFWNHRALQPAF